MTGEVGTPLAFGRAVLTRRRTLDRRQAPWPRRAGGRTRPRPARRPRPRSAGGTEFAGLPFGGALRPGQPRLVADRLHARGTVRSHGRRSSTTAASSSPWLDRARFGDVIGRDLRPGGRDLDLVAPMSIGRIGHTATLLDGAHCSSVMAAWESRIPAQASSERFDLPRDGGRTPAPCSSVAIGTRRRCSSTAGSSSRAAARPTARPRRPSCTTQRWLLDPDNRHDPRPAGAGRRAVAGRLGAGRGRRTRRTASADRRALHRPARSALVDGVAVERRA